LHQQRWQVNRARRCGSSEREKASQTGTRLTERTRVLIPEKARRIKRSESDESWRASVETRLNRDEVVEVGGCDDFVSRPISEMSLCSCQFLCIAHVWWVLIKIYLLTYLFLRCQTLNAECVEMTQPRDDDSRTVFSTVASALCCQRRSNREDASVVFTAGSMSDRIRTPVMYWYREQKAQLWHSDRATPFVSCQLLHYCTKNGSWSGL